MVKKKKTLMTSSSYYLFGNIKRNENKNFLKIEDDVNHIKTK